MNSGERFLFFASSLRETEGNDGFCNFDFYDFYDLAESTMARCNGDRKAILAIDIYRHLSLLSQNLE